MEKIVPGGLDSICRHPTLVVMEYDRTWPGRGHIVLAGWGGRILSIYGRFVGEVMVAQRRPVYNCTACTDGPVCRTFLLFRPLFSKLCMLKKKVRMCLFVCSSLDIFAPKCVT